MYFGTKSKFISNRDIATPGLPKFVSKGDELTVYAFVSNGIYGVAFTNDNVRICWSFIKDKSNKGNDISKVTITTDFSSFSKKVDDDFFNVRLPKLTEFANVFKEKEYVIETCLGLAWFIEVREEDVKGMSELFDSLWREKAFDKICEYLKL